MGVTEILIVFFISSWMVFFAVVGTGVRSQEEAGEVTAGTEPAAPENPMILKKFAWSCIGGLVVTVLFYIAAVTGLFQLLRALSPFADI